MEPRAARAQRARGGGNSRGQHSHAAPSVLRMSPRKKCSAGVPSPKSTRVSAAGSGTIIRSPAVPNGVSKIGPNADIIMLLCVQPTPLPSREGSSLAGKPLPRTWPEMSQVATKTSSSRCKGVLPRGADVAGNGSPVRQRHQRRGFGTAARERQRAARVEAAAGGRIDRARHVALQHQLQTAAARVRHGCGGDQRLGIRVQRAREQRVAIAISTMRPRYITATRCADVLHHAEIVRDEQVGDAALVLQIAQQVQHLRLHRDVERRDRLVRHDQAGAAPRAPARCRAAGAVRRRTRTGSCRAASPRKPDAVEQRRDLVLAAFLGRTARRNSPAARRRSCRPCSRGLSDA